MTLDDRLTKAKGIILSPDDGTWSYMTDTTQDKKAILSDLEKIIEENFFYGDEQQNKTELLIEMRKYCE